MSPVYLILIAAVFVMLGLLVLVPGLGLIGGLIDLVIVFGMVVYWLIESFTAKPPDDLTARRDRRDRHDDRHDELEHRRNERDRRKAGD